jgi:hypothetical protein
LICCSTNAKEGFRQQFTQLTELQCQGKSPKGSYRSLSGGRIGEELYHVIGGVDECVIWRCQRDENGQWQRIAIEDARHLRVIKTDNMGDIEIRKRTKPSYTLKLLRELRVMLTKDAVESDVIITIG